MNESPLKPDIKANTSYQRRRNENIIDVKIFPPCYSKTEQIGAIRRHTFIIKCDMNRGFHFEELILLMKKSKN